MKQSMMGEVEPQPMMLSSSKKKLKLDAAVAASSTLPKFSSPIKIPSNNDVFLVPIHGFVFTLHNG